MIFLCDQGIKAFAKIKGPNFTFNYHKGKGLQQAEEDQVKYHAPRKFDAATGNNFKTRRNLPKYQDVLA
jgi:1-deoxy-D-xylulose-5-phosphate synthase